MKKGFTTFLSALKANTPLFCKKGHSSLRFLSLFLILFLAVGNVWAELTAHTPGVYEKTVAEEGYGCTLTTVATGKNAGVFEVYYFSANSKYSNTTDVYGGESKQQYRLMCADDDSEYQLINTSSTDIFTDSCDWIEMAYKTTGFAKSDYTYSNVFNEFFAITPNGGNIDNKKTCCIKPKEGDVLTLKVSGYEEFAILGADNGSSKYMTITVDGGTPNSWKSNTLSRRSVELTTGEHTIVVANVGTSANSFYGFSLKLPSCDATAPGNISKGALVAGELTLTADGSAESGDIWYWQDAVDGTATNLGTGATKNVNTAGMYYIRSYNTAGDCWSAAKSFEVKTTDLVANYTVIYKDGATELDRETVEVGNAPAGITAPTKDCYTFAGWDPALNTVSGNEGDEIEVNATWTANYSTSATLISDDVVSGKPNVNTVFAVSNIVSSITFASGNYEFTSNETKKGYYGYKDKQSGDNMKILVQQGKQVQVLFGNLGSDPTITANGVAQSLDASRATGDNAENTFTYTASAADALISITMGSGTNTLKKIDIYSLYNATYIDDTGDASGSDENVTEVTLPTPTETTVGGYSFTGWVADKTVYKGETAKTAGSGLNAGETYTLTANTVFNAQWALIADFDVKFFQGYGDPNAQIGETQSISTGEYATAPEDPTRTGYAFLGWSYDGTEAHIVDVATYGVTAATNFTAMWKAVWTVTFDGAGKVEVQDGETVASPNSPVQAGKVFQGWYNAEVKYDFSSAVAGNLALTSKWADADPNHYVYAYNDDFHFDGVVYKTPEGAVDGGSGTSNITMTTPYTLFAGAEGITSIVMTDGIYDSKTGAIQAVTALMKVNNNATSKLTVTIKSGYTATLKIKSSGYSATRAINVSDATPASGTTTGQAVTSGAMSVSGIGELSFALTSGSHDLTVTGGTLYITELDIEATALPTYTVTYKAGDGTSADVVDADATEVSDGSTMFTAPEGKIFNGWKDGDNNDVEVGAIVTGNMTLTAQWINHYAVTFNLQGHGDAIDPQDIKEGAKATEPTAPSAIGYDFGGWFTDAACTEGNEFDFDTPITAATELFAKWTEFDGCVLLVPATSGDAPAAVGDVIDTQAGSFGATITALDKVTNLTYNANGLQFGSTSGVKVKVVLNNEMEVGTTISLKLVAAGTGTRGLFLYDASGNKINDFTCWVDGTNSASNGAEGTFTYTVKAGDGLEGANEFQLGRNNTVILNTLKITDCGAAITYHNLTSAVDPEGKGTVTLGAASVREGYTTTATYSEIDPLYEFVNWTVSGEGASVADATANPATITVGTEDAVVTLNLQLIPVKFTVEYYDGATAMGTEQVVVNEHPTASDIVTAKRGYVFEGWATSSTATASDVINLNTITSDVATDIPLYAIYTAVPCVSEGTVFSMTVTDPVGTQYEENNEFGLEIGATYLGGKAYSGSKSTTKRIGEIDENGEYSFNKNGDVTVKVAMDCALQEGDVITFTTSTNRELKIQKVAGSDLVTTSGKKYVIPAESPLIGEYDFYLMRANSESTFKTLKVERPYTISFDMQGHGDAIEAQKLIAGDKVFEPAAPTASGFDFKGWYKESACTNAWDFENDVVAGTMALYAKWDVHVTNDATLKSLKYGSEAIALEDGVFEYNIGLPALTASVPALTAVANSATVHSLDIVDAAAFDVDGNATSTVTVVSEDETVTNVYTVNFSKMAELPQVNIAASTTWDFSTTVAGSTTLENQTDVVLANMPGINNNANFNSQALIGSFNKLPGNYFQGSKLSFTTEVAGKLTITFRGTNNNERHLQVCVGDGETVVADWNYQGSGESAQQTQTVFVPVGKVTLKAFEGEVAQNARIYNMIFNANPDYIRSGLTVGSLGTICLPSNVPAGHAFGATFYELVGKEPQYGKIVFDEILSGELAEGVPYLFQAQSDVLYCFYGTENVATPDNSGAMKGTFEDMTLTDLTNIYYFAQKALWSCVDLTSLSVPANRAYVKMDEMPAITESTPAPGRRRITLGVQGAQVATGVDQVQGDEVPTKMIINGQLFILRGEKMYDAQGKLVK